MIHRRPPGLTGPFRNNPLARLMWRAGFDDLTTQARIHQLRSHIRDLETVNARLRQEVTNP